MDSTLSDFLTQVLQAVASIGGLSKLAMVSVCLTLLVSSMKVTFLNKLVWSHLGPFQTWVAPILGLIAGILGLGAGGAPFSLALVFAYFTAGAGAVFLHEILDGIKLIPGLGPIWMALIDLIEGALGGPASQPKPAPAIVPPTK
jgi:hypothetical protein